MNPNKPGADKAAEEKLIVIIQEQDHYKIVLRNEKGDTYTSKSEDLKDFLSGCQSSQSGKERAALAELVRLKILKDQLDATPPKNQDEHYDKAYADYKANKEKAWLEARQALSTDVAKEKVPPIPDRLSDSAGLLPDAGDQDKLWKQVFYDCALPTSKDEIEMLKSKYTLTRK